MPMPVTAGCVRVLLEQASAEHHTLSTESSGLRGRDGQGQKTSPNSERLLVQRALLPNLSESKAHETPLCKRPPVYFSEVRNSVCWGGHRRPEEPRCLLSHVFPLNFILGRLRRQESLLKTAQSSENRGRFEQHW